MQNSQDYPRYHLPLLAIGIFCLPIKLSFSYCILIPLIIIHCAEAYRGRRSLLGPAPHLVIPLIIYFITLTVLSAAGLNPLKSATKSLSALFMALLIPLYAGVQGERPSITVLTALLAGQTLAGLHSILQALGVPVPASFFVGEVTESGQLALTIPLMTGLICFLAGSSVRQREEIKKFSPTAQRLTAVLLTLMMLTSCFSQSLQLGQTLTIALATGAGAFLCFFAVRLFWAWRSNPQAAAPLAPVLTLICAPILVTTFIINLKRGPWAGTLVGLAIYLSIFRPRTVLPIAVAAMLAAVTIKPIHDRILSAPEHFFISGGRSEIWDIGFELMSTYPLGIGFKNSAILGKFSTDIPDNLKHFHSNPINIAVESGMIGLALFSWWIFAALRSAWQKHDQSGNHHALTIGIACALISWQVAGLVEYNVGDSEVLYIAYVLTGILGALRCRGTLAVSSPHETREVCSHQAAHSA